MTYTVLVTGDRSWTDTATIRTALEIVFASVTRQGVDLAIIHGAAPGADSIAGQVGNDLGATVHSHPAEWKRYGKRAGPIRNREMLALHPEIDFVLAFHDDLDASKGTKDMVKLTTKRDIPTMLISSEAAREKARGA